MGRTEALQGVRMAMFLNLLHRLESAELNQEGGEASGGRRADVPALDVPLRSGRRRGLLDRSAPSIVQDRRYPARSTTRKRRSADGLSDTHDRPTSFASCSIKARQACPQYR
jgi:hypothetical protein